MSSVDSFVYSAVVLDLDGVITATRHLHVQAWRRAFDEYLATLRPRGAEDNNNLRPFDPLADYVNYVDGKPRDDGVRSFLASRGIALPEGKDGDSAEMSTVHGLSKRKNGYYLELLEREGPHVFRDAVEALTLWQARGVPMAVVSSSRNCAQVLKMAGVDRFFKVRVDGVVGKALGLRGKPEPDYFLVAARRLDIDPSTALMVEDAVAGVEAGRRGGFGTVIGMDRSGKNTAILLKHGADRVVSSLSELLRDAPEVAA